MIHVAPIASTSRISRKKFANDSILKGGTWAYLGSAKEQDKAKRYFFWTSLNTDIIGAGKPIPVIIQTGDGKFYVSETITGQRTDSKGKKYVAVSQSTLVMITGISRS